MLSFFNLRSRTVARLNALGIFLVASVAFIPHRTRAAQVLAPQSNQVTIRLARNPDPAPEFKLWGLDGKPITLADSRGKVILLNFWAMWCGPCRAEIPDLIALQSRYKDRLQIIGLAVDVDNLDELKTFIAASGINYLSAVATTDVRVRYGSVTALPTSFILDSEGRAVQKHIGLRNPLLYELEIRALLGLPIPAKVETFEDTGEIFLKNADRATSLPGVDLSKLSTEQKAVALRSLNATSCTCGCNLTLAQCRINDTACQVSLGAANKAVADILGVPPDVPSPTAAAPSSPSNSSPNAPAVPPAVAPSHSSPPSAPRHR